MIAAAVAAVVVAAVVAVVVAVIVVAVVAVSACRIFLDSCFLGGGINLQPRWPPPSPTTGLIELPNNNSNNDV